MDMNGSHILLYVIFFLRICLQKMKNKIVATHTKATFYDGFGAVASSCCVAFQQCFTVDNSTLFWFQPASLLCLMLF